MNASAVLILHNDSCQTMLKSTALKNVLLLLTIILSGVASFHSKLSHPVYRMTSLKGFSDPNWNWGSSLGTGHDAAMKLRLRLGTSDKRADFIASIVGNSKDFDLEDVKLALALRFQRASRERIAGSEEGYEIMDKMAMRKYENADGEAYLLRDLEELVSILPVDLMSEAGMTIGPRPLFYTAAKVLCGMKFCTAGL